MTILPGGKQRSFCNPLRYHSSPRTGTVTLRVRRDHQRPAATR
jgi:hypothetical protein